MSFCGETVAKHRLQQCFQTLLNYGQARDRLQHCSIFKNVARWPAGTCLVHRATFLMSISTNESANLKNPWLEFVPFCSPAAAAWLKKLCLCLWEIHLHIFRTKITNLSLRGMTPGIRENKGSPPPLDLGWYLLFPKEWKTEMTWCSCGKSVWKPTATNDWWL